jgi:hypothetical protein
MSLQKGYNPQNKANTQNTKTTTKRNHIGPHCFTRDEQKIRHNDNKRDLEARISNSI